MQARPGVAAEQACDHSRCSSGGERDAVKPGMELLGAPVPRRAKIPSRRLRPWLDWLRGHFLAVNGEKSLRHRAGHRFAAVLLANGARPPKKGRGLSGMEKAPRRPRTGAGGFGTA
jgi:hypothetical protein